MKIKIKLFLIFHLVILSCNGQEKENKKITAMRDRVDLHLLEKMAKKTPVSSDSFIYEYEVKKDNGDFIFINGNNEDGYTEKVLTSKPFFQTIYKEYYPDGYIKKKESYFGERTKIDTSEYYDEKGNVEKVDENKKFGKIKPNDILKFLEKKKNINLSTSEGRFDENGNPSFEVQFDDHKKTYLITIVNGKPNDKAFDGIGEPPAFLPIKYKMDGETGKVEEVD